MGKIRILSIAGSDSSAGAGIQRDIKTCLSLGAEALTAVTALTAQSRFALRAVHPVSPSLVAQQLRAIDEDGPIDAIKIGMLANSGIIDVVVAYLKSYLKSRPGTPVVLDPVLRASAGGYLLDPEAIDSLTQQLIPLVSIITPNTAEASRLLKHPIESKSAVEDAAWELRQLGAKSVLITGGDNAFAPATDCLSTGNSILWFHSTFIPCINTHGTGCCFSSALAVALAQGASIQEATQQAKELICKVLTEGLVHA